MDNLEHRVLEVVAKHGPIQAHGVWEAIVNSNEFYETEDVEIQVSVEEILGILNDAVEYELLIKDEKGFRFP